MHAILLIATLAALASGPLWYLLARRRPALLSFLDGFVLVSISGLVLLEVLPDAFGDGGWWSLVFVALGLLGPTAMEHGLTRVRRSAHLFAMGLAIVGLVLHSLGDGAALATEDAHAHGALGLAIAIHSVPVGLVVWWLLYPVFGFWLPALALAAMCVGTVTGYLFGVSVAGLLGTEGWAWFQALIAGSILHVIFGRPHLDEDAVHHHSLPPFEGLGNLTALSALAAFSHAHEGPLTALASTTLQLGLAVAPALLIGYALISVLARLGLWTRGGSAWPAALAIGFALVLLAPSWLGMPLMLPWALAPLVAAVISLHWLLGAATERGSQPQWPQALRAGFVTAVDRGAAWTLAGFTLAVLVTTYGTDAPSSADAKHYQWASLWAVLFLHAATLLRRGGRALLTDLFGDDHGAAHH